MWDALSDVLVSFAVGVVELFPTSPFAELVHPGQYVCGHLGDLAVLRGGLLRVPGRAPLGEGD